MHSFQNAYSSYEAEQNKKYEDLVEYNNKILVQLEKTKIELEETKTKLVNVRKIIGSL
jgi:hypothetical protein